MARKSLHEKTETRGAVGAACHQSMRKPSPVSASTAASVATLTAAAVAVTVPTAATAAACTWAGSDPPSNFVAHASCVTAAACTTHAIVVLDRARARLGQPEYQLPGNFDQLSAAEQAFVLTNLDRRLYGLPPILGLGQDLDQRAAAAVRSDSDPMTSAPNITALTSNWAGGYRDMLFAYEAWMYDDGPGSANVACTRSTTSGCWAHRHNILWRFGSGRSLAMGAAAGTGRGGAPSFAMLLVHGAGSYRPAYVYTWSEAVAAGAGGSAPSRQNLGVSGAASSDALKLTGLHVRRGRFWFHIAAPPGASPECALTRLAKSEHDHFQRCGAYTADTRLRRGRYRLRVRAGKATVTRYVRVP